MDFVSSSTPPAARAAARGPAGARARAGRTREATAAAVAAPGERPSAPRDDVGRRRGGTAVSMLAKKSDEWEVPRKIFHMSIGFVTIAAYRRPMDPGSVSRVLFASFLVASAAEVARARSAHFNALYVRLFGFLMRSPEKTLSRVNGTVYYLLGTALVLAIFPVDIAVVSICYLSWCDPLASLFGKMFGHLTPRFPNRKSLAGTLAACLAGCAITHAFWTRIALPNQDLSWTPARPDVPLNRLTVVGGVIAGLAELTNIGGFDDNLVMPLLASAGLWTYLRWL